MSMFLHINCFSGGRVFDTRVPLLTDEVSKCSRARQWKGISGRRLRRIDTVKRLSKLGDGLRLNAEGTARQSRNQNERAEEHAEKWRRKIFNAENTEECRETQSGKVAEMN